MLKVAFVMLTIIFTADGKIETSSVSMESKAECAKAANEFVAQFMAAHPDQAIAVGCLEVENSRAQ